MLTESFLAATLSANKPAQHLSSALKDVGIFLHELQPENTLRQGFKKSSIQPHSLAASRGHFFAAQSGKAVVNVYNRQKGNQEATVPFPEKITSISYANGLEVLVLGTEEGKLILWEVGTGRITTSTAAHLQRIDLLCICPSNDVILTASPDSSIHVWSVAKLLSFQASADSYSTTTTSNAPLMTFAQHRDGITALAVGHSRRTTNFAVSASADRTCHIWHIDSCELVRTILLPSCPSCMCLDPADRAVYLGDAAGNITSIDLVSLGQTSPSTTNSTMVPVQITDKEQWRQTSGDTAAHTVAASYDGTTLLTGHADGSILRWDVAKRKVAGEVTKLGQPVTNLCMLQPEGLQQDAKPTFIISEVIKPKLEFNSQLDDNAYGIPPKYKLHASLAGSDSSRNRPHNAVHAAMTSDGWNNTLLEEAVGAVGETPSSSQSNGTISNSASSDRLALEVAELKKTVAAYQQADMDRMEHSIQRMRKRADIDLKRREVYHAAIQRGEDKKAANAAMKAFMDGSSAELAVLEAQEDTEAFGEHMDTT